MKNINVLTNYHSTASRAAHITRRTGARVSSPSSGVRPGARALNLELPTSFGISLLVGVLGLLFGGLLLSHSAYAASYLNVSSGGAVSLGSIRPTSSGTSSTGSDTLTVHTDCSAGYSVYVSGQNGKDTNLTNSSAESNNTISTSSNAIGSAGSLSSNTWGLNYENTGTYYGLPTYANATKKATVTKTSVPESSTVPIYYGIKVDTSVTPGTYTGDVLYTILPNSACTAYTVRFNANGGSGTMNSQTINVGQATNLSANTFARSGYTFLGWSTDPSAVAPTYKDAELVKDITDFNAMLNLYAIWGFISGNMQNWDGCASLVKNGIVYLTDTRDSNVYAVKKLADNKCWMVQDMKLVGEKTLTASNSDVSSDFDLTTSTDAPSASTWCTTNSAECDNVSRVYYNPAEASDPSQSSYYGALYNWYATTAGTGRYATTSGDVSSSICPKGWRLPKNGSDADVNDFIALDIAWDGTGKNRNDANTYSMFTGNYGVDSNGNFNMTGRILGGAATSTGVFGLYWSSTGNNNSQAFGFMIDSRYSSISPWLSNGNKYAGQAVRCIAQDNYTISYSSDGADSGEASKTSETVFQNNGTVNVAMPTVGNMTKSGYEFKGWALTSGATEAVYQAEETVALSALLTAASSAGQATTPGSTITLYPVWEKSIAYMQDFVCSTLAAGTSTTLADARDGQEYTVYRFPTDVKYAGTSTVANVAGKCIMTKNLNLGAVASISGASSSITANGTMTLSPEDSGFTTPTGSGESITVPTSSVTVSAPSSWSGTSAYSNKQYKANGTGNYAGRGYYSWGAAMVVCPKNWRLPTADEYYTGSAGSWEVQTGGIAAIVKGSSSSATTSNITGSPYSFVLGGHYVGSFDYATSYGYYWSSTQSSSTGSYGLDMHSSNGLKRYNGTKYAGFAVRCIADEYPDDGNLGTMQTDNICSKVTPGHTATLTDSRDNQTYSVYRWPDTGTAATDYPTGMAGYCIMTKDLSLGYVTGGSITKGSNLTLTTATSAAAATITARASVSDWSSSDNDKQYINFSGTYSSHSYYSQYAAQAVCPKGWSLPTSTQYSRLRALVGNDDKKIMSAPYNFVLGGQVVAGSYSDAYQAGSYAYYWSNNIGWLLYFYSGSMSTRDKPVYVGMSVRCAAK